MFRITSIAYVENLDEVKKITREVKEPVSIAAGMPYNLKNFTIKDLKDLGVSRVSLPTLLINSSLEAMKRSLNLVKVDEMYKLSD